MKKIIVTLFIFMCFTQVMASTPVNDKYGDRTDDSAMRNIWNMKDEIDINDTSIQINVDNNNIFKKDIQDGYRYVVALVAAHKIFENGHGARICNMELQHQHNTYEAWVRWDECYTFCMNGYYGNNCDNLVANITPSTQPAPRDEDFTDIFKLAPQSTTPGKTNWEIDTFGVNANGVIPLVVVEVKEHAVAVRPIWIGSHTSTTEISNAYYHDKNSSETWLCADGWTGTNGNCTRLSGPTHCPAGQGFADDDDTTCITCGETRKSGVKNNGVCEHCEADKIFSETSDGCVSAIKLTRQNMRENENFSTTIANYISPKCWSLTDSGDYKDCVKSGRHPE